MNNLGDPLLSSGRYEEAQTLLRQAQDVAAHVVGANHSIYAAITYNLARIAARSHRGLHHGSAVDGGPETRRCITASIEEPFLSDLQSLVSPL